jgi:hypothetical protein
VSKNDLFLNCRRKMKELSKKELSNVTPASVRQTDEQIYFFRINYEHITKKPKTLIKTT